MPINSDKIQKVKNHLSRHLKSCSVCGARTWDINNEICFYQMLDLEYKMPIEGKVNPVVVVTCNECHHVVAFNAVKLGLL